MSAAAYLNRIGGFLPYMNGFVSIPRDLTKVKSKLIFNMTRRQLICFGTAAAIGAASMPYVLNINEMVIFVGDAVLCDPQYIATIGFIFPGRRGVRPLQIYS